MLHRTKPTDSSIRRALHDVAEIALEARSREEFRLTSLERICRVACMDSGAMSHSAFGLDVHMDAWGIRPEQTRASLMDVMNELAVEEMQRSLCGHVVADDQLFTAARRSTLLLYRDILAPVNISSFCGRMHFTRYGLVWMTFARDGHRARYSEADLAALDSLSSVLAAGDALHAKELSVLELSAEERRAWARERRVTHAEHQVARR